MRSLQRAYLAAFLLLAAAWFGGLEYRGLFQPDEGRYAEIAREMLASGDWVTPRLNDLEYFEKPPLQYWATAVSFALFGEDEWTARLWPAITGFFGVLFLLFAGNRIGPPGAGRVAALVLGSSCAYFLSSQYLTLDMGLAFFMSATLLCFLLAQWLASRRWMLGAWAAMACAVLTKGFVGVLLPAIVLGLYVLWERDWRLVRRLEWRWGLALFAAIVLPWFALVQMRNPDFLRFFVIQEHIERFLVPHHGRDGPWWYFIAIFALGMLPWTAALPGVMKRALEAPQDARISIERLLVLWVVVIVAFFSISSSKLPAYIVPAFPAVALLIGRDVARRSFFDLRWPGLIAACAAAGALAFLLPKLTDFVAYVPWVTAAAIVIIVAGLCSSRMKPAASGAGLLALAFGSVAAMQLALSGLHHVDENYSAEQFVERFLGENRSFAPQAPFYSVGCFEESMPFYLGRTLTLVAHRGELAPGIRAEPQKFVPTVEEFRQRWVASSEAYATMRPELYAQLAAKGLPMRVLAVDAKRVIVSREAAEPPTLAKSPGLFFSWMSRELPALRQAQHEPRTLALELH